MFCKPIDKSLGLFNFTPNERATKVTNGQGHFNLEMKFSCNSVG